QDVPDELIREWIETNTPGLPLGDVAALKRIFFESQTLVLSSLRQSILDPDATAKQRLPEAEKSQRLSAFKAANPGLFLDATSEPGHSLLELACEQERQNVLQHIPIEKCVSRQHEILNHQKPSKMLELEAGHIAVKETSEVPEQPVHGALALLEGLKRRGYAYVMARCVSLAPYEAYLAKLMQHFRRAPPPSHQRVGIEQLIDADKMVFVYLLEQGVKPRAKTDGSYELDTALHDALNSYQVLTQYARQWIGDVLPVSEQCIYFDVPVVFELFAGTGRVTACLRKLGLKSSHGIDHVVTENVGNGPQPLRSAEYPDGLPTLAGGRHLSQPRFLTFVPSGSHLTIARSEETAYPPPLAAHIASAIAQHLVDCGWKWEDRAAQLEQEEEKLKDLGYKDAAVFNEVVEGTDLL
ncbi:unnamed protein product, partial [Symbiodinium sp. KB8]